MHKSEKVVLLLVVALLAASCAQTARMSVAGPQQGSDAERQKQLVFTPPPRPTQEASRGNDPEGEEWFMDQALGMFINWSMDSQLGTVIGHTVVGASDDYLDRFINELPQSFYPRKFDPEDWARLAKLAGFKYVVFDTKAISGFCMFDTKSTEFNIMNTPYGRDITRQVVDAFREQGLAVGIYFCEEDGLFLHSQGHDIARVRDYAKPSNNPELRDYNRVQIRELMSNYGKIDMLFIDASDSLDAKETAWGLQPKLVITRGEMQTPEQKIPDQPMPGPWESCFTLGTQWQFKPTNDEHKSGTKLIEMLIEIRAKGGNFLLSIGPTPDGEIPFEQTRRIRELAAWMFINREAVYEIRPWHVIREGDVWFTKASNENAVYAFLTKIPNWKRSDRKEFTIKSVKATDATTVSVLGQTGRVVEYKPTVDGMARWTQGKDGLHISVVRAQRIYNNHKWPNPIVVKITNVEPAK